MTIDISENVLNPIVAGAQSTNRAIADWNKKRLESYGVPAFITEQTSKTKPMGSSKGLKSLLSSANWKMMKTVPHGPNDTFKTLGAIRKGMPKLGAYDLNGLRWLNSKLDVVLGMKTAQEDEDINSALKNQDDVRAAATNAVSDGAWAGAGAQAMDWVKSIFDDKKWKDWWNNIDWKKWGDSLGNWFDPNAWSDWWNQKGKWSLNQNITTQPKPPAQPQAPVPQPPQPPEPNIYQPGQPFS